MRIHLLAPPHVPLTTAYELDGFVQRTILFAETLKALGHTVWLYGCEGATDAPCDRYVPMIPAARVAHLMGEAQYQHLHYDAANPIFLDANRSALATIQSFKEPRDVIATICGTAQRMVFDQHPELLALEYSIGYQGVFAPYRVFQSHVWRHAVHGMWNMDGGREFDAVIPPWFHNEAMPYTARPDPYVVYCGRIVSRKGVMTACKAAELAGVKLILIGSEDQPNLISYGEYRGTVSTPERNELLSRAQACLMPTQYVEPFGNVAAEAQLCGTPVISTDYGAFVESVEQGKTGFRCSYLGEFVDAIHRAPSLDRSYIRARATRLYGFDAGLEQYRAYFHRLSLLWQQGWETREVPEREMVVAA